VLLQWNCLCRIAKTKIHWKYSLKMIRIQSCSHVVLILDCRLVGSCGACVRHWDDKVTSEVPWLSDWSNYDDLIHGRWPSMPPIMSLLRVFTWKHYFYYCGHATSECKVLMVACDVAPWLVGFMVNCGQRTGSAWGLSWVKVAIMFNGLGSPKLGVLCPFSIFAHKVKS